ncbi:HD-like signal output (HDOD) domain, no enzymatic activity [Ectothiorhodospira magna]|uniref:HD-like signal output (HDOD) domain, no enzymatic activity n=1 Tax=Ectothiorhodospira magna TaxID=867345 RepID=A0A1H9CBH0_9GAMM|nr:HDOD domain-containing protein [Ectothiorhodospira magna]SEP98489.1 HD-like signal output (HDOD) domain, no enzymatic activity [Ectothiorhodospira magna]
MATPEPEAWISALGDYALPLLPGTPAVLEGLESDQLSSMRVLGRLIQWDVGLALRVIRVANEIPHRHFRCEVAGLDEAAMMIGIRGVLGCMNALAQATSASPADPVRYAGLAAQASYAALLAERCGALRRDMVPGELALAAQLHGLGELMLVAHQGDCLASYLDLMAQDETVSPDEARDVTLDETINPVKIGQQLATRWALPEMTRRCMLPANARHPRNLGVMLSAQLAREAMRGWRYPGLGRDLELLADCLNIDLETLVMHLNEVSGEFNLQVALYGVSPVPELDLEQVMRQRSGDVMSPLPALCLAPRLRQAGLAAKRLQAGDLADEDEVLSVLLTGLHHGLGLSRVVFARLREGDCRLVVERTAGVDHEPGFCRLSMDMADGELLSVLMKRPTPFWLNQENMEDIWPKVPDALRRASGVRAFFIHSLFVGDRPFGLIYADRRFQACALDRRLLSGFSRLVTLAQQELERLDKAGADQPQPRQKPVGTLS